MRSNRLARFNTQREIGVCPQFDVFYPDLTTREHVLFFARLKGTPRSEEADVVVRSAKHSNEVCEVFI